MRQPATNPSTISTLEQIREQMRDMCDPRYHEFHKITVEHGYIQITMPKRRP